VIAEIEEVIMANQAPPPHQLLLSFFKVMGNADRLRIAARLMESPPATVSDLADALSLKKQAVAEHIAALRAIDLAIPAADNAFTFDLAALLELNRYLLARENLPTPIDDWPDEEVRKTLRPFFEGYWLRQIPEGNKRFQMLLNWLVTCFDMGVHYSERQVNDIITQYNPDYATLRRGLIDAGLMQRDHGTYWRVA
jgi:ArsR family transcriptional regulator, arsenate/arsenite/antimonite-responsive transcriptional repressor